MSIRRPLPVRALVLALLATLATAFAAGAAPAHAAPGAWWLMKSTPDFRHLKPGTKAIIYSMATDIGYENVTGTSTNKLAITDTVPAGLKVINVDAEAGVAKESGNEETGKFETLYPKCQPPVGQTYTCELEGLLRPAEDIRVQIEVEVEPGDALGSTLTNTFEVKGGETPKGATPEGNRVQTPMLVSEEPVKFEAERFELKPETDEGKPDTQAGSHPFQLTTVFDLAKIAKYGFTLSFENLLPLLPALPRDLHFTLPPGMVGAVAHMPKCDGTNFVSTVEGENDGCEPDAAIGFANATLDEPINSGPFTEEVPVFNLTPDAGEPARFGFIAHTVPVVVHDPRRARHLRRRSGRPLPARVDRDPLERSHVLGRARRLAAQQRPRMGLPRRRLRRRVRAQVQPQIRSRTPAGAADAADLLRRRTDRERPCARLDRTGIRHPVQVQTV